ncbi:MAG: hypothetical protein FJW38_25725 [Acidobacteria bacterium]|nr:hypothetical protein [Acidobacteriota bacterium]
MNTECSSLELQLADYLAGVPSAEVDAHLAVCEQCRASVALWSNMAAMPAPVAPRMRLQLPRPRNYWPLALAASALLAAGLGFYGGRASAPSNDIASLRKEVRSLREVVALSLLDQQSASERLRGIRYSASVDASDPELAEALSHTLRADPSVDVRLAAADALRRFPQSTKSRESMWQILNADDSPLVQIAVIDLLSEDPRLPQLLNNGNIHPSVKEYVQAVLANPQKRGFQ